MKKLFGKDSGAVAGVGGISVHQPPCSSDWFVRSQNSIVRPVLSWNHAGKPPTVGLVLMGPMRSSAALALCAAGSRTAIAARAPTSFFTLNCFICLYSLVKCFTFGTADKRGPSPSRGREGAGSACLRFCGPAVRSREVIDAGARPALPLAGCAVDQGRLVEHVTMKVPGLPGTGCDAHLALLASALVMTANCAATTSAIVSAATSPRDSVLFMVLSLQDLAHERVGATTYLNEPCQSLCQQGKPLCFQGADEKAERTSG